ncbi:putative lipoprotein [Chondromyces apiculatus DSM 436]|uniref:Putative lipoprotein n=2 Tax=Chondromyces apiculatus TaxID=51 RepID=A0A017T1L9_9BACT|nr:putative lipoprotein [Chondromyces apiculatus DSM 436]
MQAEEDEGPMPVEESSDHLDVSGASVTAPEEGVGEESVVFHENFYGDGDLGQCNNKAYGHVSATMGAWTPKIRIDTDGRSGGCYQQFGITDPASTLRTLKVEVNFYANGDGGQCNNPGLRTIPISSDAVQWSSRYRIDTDDRSGGCYQVFKVSGRDDIGLDVEFLPDGDGGQCGLSGTKTATSTNQAKFLIDTDGRSGGCTQRFRLRHL